MSESVNGGGAVTVWAALGTACAAILAAFRFWRSPPPNKPGRSEECLRRLERIDVMEVELARIGEHQFRPDDRERLAQLASGIGSVQVALSDHLFPKVNKLAERLARVEAKIEHRSGPRDSS